MVIYTLTEKDKSLFSDFISANVLAQLGMPGFYSLGLFDEKADDEPLGFAQFYTGFFEDDDTIPTLLLIRLYVKEEARYEGAGTKLLSMIKEIGRKSGAERIIAICPLPKPMTEAAGEKETAETDPDEEEGERPVYSDEEALRRCLEKQGFVFKDWQIYRVVRSFRELEKLPFLKGISVANVRPFSSMDRAVWNQFMKEVPAELRSDILFAIEDRDRQRYDMDLSCVYVRDYQILGILLIWKLASGPLEILRMRGMHERDPMVLISMLRFMGIEAIKKYSEDQLLMMPGLSEPARQLIKKVFPEYTPEKALLGIWTAEGSQRPSGKSEKE